MKREKDTEKTAGKPDVNLSGKEKALAQIDQQFGRGAEEETAVS